jgi:anti-sigma B factor antagonist
MVLKVQTQISGHVIILHCEGRIVFGDEGAALHERVRNLLAGTAQIVVNLRGVDHIDSGGIGVLVGLFVAARNRGGELKVVSPNEHVYTTLRRTCLDTVFRIYASDDFSVELARPLVVCRLTVAVDAIHHHLHVVACGLVGDRGVFRSCGT